MKNPEVAKTWHNISKEQQLKLELDFWSDAAIGLCAVIDELEAQNKALEAENKKLIAYLMEDE